MKVLFTVSWFENYTSPLKNWEGSWTDFVHKDCKVTNHRWPAQQVTPLMSSADLGYTFGHLSCARKSVYSSLYYFQYYACIYNCKIIFTANLSQK